MMATMAMVLRVAPAQPRRRQRTHRKSQPPANRRARRAIDRKAGA